MHRQARTLRRRHGNDRDDRLDRADGRQRGRAPRHALSEHQSPGLFLGRRAFLNPGALLGPDPFLGPGLLCPASTLALADGLPLAGGLGGFRPEDRGRLEHRSGAKWPDLPFRFRRG